MSWTYSGDPGNSDVDRYRFLIGDTLETTPIMQDEEIQFVVDTWAGNENKILYQLFNRAAVLFARDIKRSLGPQEEDPKERIVFFKEKAAEYKASIVNSGLSVPKYAYPKVFRKGMQNNPVWQDGVDGDKYVR